jgi:hypothetical protein
VRHKKSNRTPSHDDYQAAKKRRSAANGVDSNGERLRKRRELLWKTGRDSMKTARRDRQTTCESPMSVDTDEAKVRARIRRTTATRAAGEARKQRIHEDELTGKRPCLRNPHDLVAKGERESGSRVNSLHDVEVGSAQACVPGSNNDLVRSYCRIRHIDPPKDVGLHHHKRTHLLTARLTHSSAPLPPQLQTSLGTLLALNHTRSVNMMTSGQHVDTAGRAAVGGLLGSRKPPTHSMWPSTMTA